MRLRAILTLLIGLVLATGSVFIAHRYMVSQPGGAVADLPRIELAGVVVAYTDIPFGQTIRPEHVRTQEWPARARPQGSFASVDEVLGDGQAPRVALRQINAGEPILRSRISGFGERATLSATVSQGKRAFTIKVNEVTGVSGFLLPGDRVDVLLTRSLEQRRDLVTDVILQDVVVRGIDQTVDEQREKPHVAKAVTVEVSTEEAQKLALAQQVGTLTLALRNARTTPEELEKVRSVRVHDLVEPETAPRAAPPTVRVRRGPSAMAVENVR